MIDGKIRIKKNMYLLCFNTQNFEI